MIRLNLYAFLTGVYLALLEFGYFLILELNVSSTYVTYMIVVSCWMVGAVTGLWWKRITLTQGLIVGLAGYYGVTYLVTLYPYSRATLVVAAVGVWLAGLWAGRFFLATFKHFKRADTLFFHENNGFLVGIVGLMVGFTTLGRPFLVWAPLGCAAAIVALNAIGKRHQNNTAEPATETSGTGGLR